MTARLEPRSHGSLNCRGLRFTATRVLIAVFGQMDFAESICVDKAQKERHESNCNAITVVSFSRRGQ